MSGAKRVDLAFSSKAIRYVCESDVRARKLFGDQAAASLQARLADLNAVDNLEELSWIRVRFGPGTAAIEFHPTLDLVLEPGGTKTPRAEDGSINWRAVDRVRIIKVGHP